jgi:hypothetical protein
MKNNRELTTLGTWTVQFHEDEPRQFAQKSGVFPYLSELMRQHSSGRIVVDEDVGGRSWVSRFVFGLHPRLLLMHFAVEWSGDVASLIFFDDAASEHRAIDRERPVQADEVARKAIAHGEVTPHPLDQCLALGRAQQAVEEYLKAGVRPKWLQYDYVA